jgi:hypothetical protein
MENQDSEKLKNQEDVRPSQALENLVKEKDTENPPKTTGTGANNPVPREESLVIRKKEDGQAGS